MGRRYDGRDPSVEYKLWGEPASQPSRCTPWLTVRLSRHANGFNSTIRDDEPSLCRCRVNPDPLVPSNPPGKGGQCSAGVDTLFVDGYEGLRPAHRIDLGRLRDSREALLVVHHSASEVVRDHDDGRRSRGHLPSRGRNHLGT